MIPTSFDVDTRAAIRARLARLEIRRLTGEMRERAAVMIPLCHVKGVPSVLFTKRSETVGTHKGQVAFPGGRRDDADGGDVVRNALRELKEEVGVEASLVEVLGLGHEVMAITGVGVSPVVGFLGDVVPARLQLQEAETEEAFAVPLSTLVDPRYRTLQSFAGGLRTAPQFTGGAHRVWGLTAVILDEFLREGLGLDLPDLMR